jgi:hypothetical protein
MLPRLGENTEGLPYFNCPTVYHIHPKTRVQKQTDGIHKMLTLYKFNRNETKVGLLGEAREVKHYKIGKVECGRVRGDRVESPC